MTTKRWRLRALAASAACLVLAPSAAQAATRPTATTKAAANVTPQSATLTGAVNPQGNETTYFFQFGTSTLYGSNTPAGNAGGGSKAVQVAAPIGGLAPATTYHYRLVAQNAAGIRRGGDRTFRTQRQPLGLSLAAAPNPVRPNSATTLYGTLTGTGNAGRQVILQFNPFPYTQGFQQLGDPHLTNDAGNFSFPVLAVPFNTQYRVFLPQNPNVPSPVVTLGVAPKVSAGAKRVRRTSRGAIVRFSGKIRPRHDGAQIAIQRLKRGTWVTISGTVSRHATSTYSKYRKKVRLRRGGSFRVYAGIADGDHVPSVSRTLHVRVR